MANIFSRSVERTKPDTSRRFKAQVLETNADPFEQVDFELEQHHWYLCRVGRELVVMRYDGINDRGKPEFTPGDGESVSYGAQDVLVIAHFGSEEP